MIDKQIIQQLLAQVPRPPEEEIPSGTSDRECNAFEQRTDIFLPDEVRQWLKITNGPCVGPGGLYGIRPQRSHLDMEAFFEIYHSWRNRKWIPIAGDGCGNYYIIPTQAEYGIGYPVLFVDTSSPFDVPAFIVASDIEHFLIALFKKELGEKGWPFNENYVTKTDPGIISFVGISLPWMSN